MTRYQTIIHTTVFYVAPIGWLWYNSLKGDEFTTEQTIINASVVIGAAIIGLIGTVIATSSKTRKKVDELKGTIQNNESHRSRDHDDIIAQIGNTKTSVSSQTGVTADTKSLSSQHGDIKALLNSVGKIVSSERNTRVKREEILGAQEVNIKAVLDGISSLNEKLIILEKEKQRLLMKNAALEQRLAELECPPDSHKRRYDEER